MVTRAHFYTGGKPCMCAHLRPKSRRIAAVGLRNTSLRLGVRGDQPGYSNVRAVLRHFVPYKGLHPLRCLRSYLSALCSGNNLLTQTVPAAKPEKPIPSARPSTENVGGLFHPIHPIKKEVMHYDKTENPCRAECREREN